MNLPRLDEIVLASLDFFIAKPPVTLDLAKITFPFVVGSGNASHTGRILFSGSAAVICDESNFKSQAAAYTTAVKQGLIKDTVVISASGEKDSVWEVEFAKSLGLQTTLLTCKPNSTAAKIADSVYAYKSIAEPYTYNTSTYLGMILSATKEDPAAIKDYINTLALPRGFEGYEAYAFVLPDKFQAIAPMIEIKRDELFGPHLMLRANSEGISRHAKFVHPWDKELVISVGNEQPFFGDPKHRWHLPIPEWAGFGFMQSLGYYICGKIQAAKPPYFFDHVGAFCTDYGPKAYGKNQNFEVIVPAND